ncbi:hypothetical protein RNR66_12015, partial [Staphylococcus pseudintermedius]|nr:hypothetical protein [Staphylococcus pseudintermedius]
ISLLFSITILFVISSSTALADHTLDPTPDQLHKSSEFKGLMGVNSGLKMSFFGGLRMTYV